MDVEINDMVLEQVPHVAQLWHHGWIDGHAKVVPAELTKLRTLHSFQFRSKENQPYTRVAMQGDDLLGFIMIKGDEVYQMYVGPTARGTGVAQRLMQEGEIRIRATGHAKSWLACAVGNERAARFYSKMGWINVGVETVELDTLDAPFPLPVWRFEKALA
ncbi:MAG: GNAT family N-acetyltransferase [Planktotalea sp.]|uniref:GNAT family N-acetyltransferase n=1 Tax=Planktotalea sp. TaxID=2029877 RepID=UPI003C77A007